MNLTINEYVMLHRSFCFVFASVIINIANKIIVGGFFEETYLVWFQRRCPWC